MQPSPEEILELKAREGTECILYSQGFIGHCYVKEVITSPWGIRCSFDPIPNAGLPNVDKGEGFINAQWDFFSNGENDWASCAQGATWWIFFGQDLIQTIIERANQLAEINPDERMYMLRMIFVDYRWGLGFDPLRPISKIQL